MTPEQCRTRVQESGATYGNPTLERICGAKFMAPLYDPSHESPESSNACIDQFEFPDIPCAYPVVWVKAKEAAELCEAEGKRLCDAHEWEGACDGRLEAPDYPFGWQKASLPRSRYAACDWLTIVNMRRRSVGSYGATYQRGICATGSTKSVDCNGGSWTQCGSNTYPAGSFPACHSPLNVYDLNGNAAEHMNLPIAPDQMSTRGSKTLGYTEMKGSWFIFDTYRAHEDWVPVARPILARYACCWRPTATPIITWGFAAATRSVNRREACARCGRRPRPAEESRRDLSRHQ